MLEKCAFKVSPPPTTPSWNIECLLKISKSLFTNQWKCKKIHQKKDFTETNKILPSTFKFDFIHSVISQQFK